MNGVGTQSLKLVFGCVRFDLITSMAEKNAKLDMHTQALILFDYIYMRNLKTTDYRECMAMFKSMGRGIIENCGHKLTPKMS